MPLLCCGCLSVGASYHIQNFQLTQTYKLIIEEKKIQNENPYIMCHLCRALLVKFTAFREQCKKAKEILQNIKKYKGLKIPSLHFYTQTKVELFTYPGLDIRNSTECDDDKEKSFTNNDINTINTIDCKEYGEISIKEENEIHTEELFFVDNVNEGINLEDSTAYNRKHSEELLLTNVKSDGNIVVEGEMNIKTKEKKLNEVKSLNSTFKETSETDIRIEEFESIDYVNDHRVKRIDLKEKIKSDIATPKVAKKSKAREEIKSKSKTALEAEERFKQRGKFFETKENIDNFERLYDVQVIVLNREQQINDLVERNNNFDYPHRCEECFKGFMDFDNLEKHMKAIHDPRRGDAVCDICKARYVDKRNLNRHLRSHRLQFVCKQCNNISRNSCKAVEHYKMHKGKLYKCEYCSKEYLNITTYLTHSRVRHPSELIWCDICGDSAISRFGLNAHKHLAHKQVVFPSTCKCKNCGVNFTNEKALEKHKADFSTELSCDKLSPCVHCGEGFSARQLLKNHLSGNHRSYGCKTLHPCAKCDKVFRKYRLYSAHYRRVHGYQDKNDLKTIICEICGKAMRNTCELRYHKRTHTGEKPFKCPECPKTFIKRACMMSHIRVHTNERPFACKLCPKTFKGPAALRGHQYVHTAEEGHQRKENGLRY